MEKAKQFAESFLGDHERAGEQPTQPSESGGTTGTGGGGLMGMASHAATAYFSGGNKEVPEGGQVGEQPQAVGGTSAGGGGESGLLGMASHAATKYFSGDKEGVGGGTADTGLVDKLLATFEQKEGRKFDATNESEYDRLTNMATNMLGTDIGRSVVKSWVKQRLGM